MPACFTLVEFHTQVQLEEIFPSYSTTAKCRGLKVTKKSTLTICLCGQEKKYDKLL